MYQNPWTYLPSLWAGTTLCPCGADNAPIFGWCWEAGPPPWWCKAGGGRSACFARLHAACGPRLDMSGKTRSLHCKLGANYVTFKPETTIEYQFVLHLVDFTTLWFIPCFVLYQTSCQQRTASTREMWFVVVYLIMNCLLLLLCHCQARPYTYQAPCWALQEHNFQFSSFF